MWYRLFHHPLRHPLQSLRNMQHWRLELPISKCQLIRRRHRRQNIDLQKYFCHRRRHQPKTNQSLHFSLV
jgi:hypothetical protein